MLRPYAQLHFLERSAHQVCTCAPMCLTCICALGSAKALDTERLRTSHATLYAANTAPDSARMPLFTPVHQAHTRDSPHCVRQCTHAPVHARASGTRAKEPTLRQTVRARTAVLLPCCARRGQQCGGPCTGAPSAARRPAPSRHH